MMILSDEQGELVIEAVQIAIDETEAWARECNSIEELMAEQERLVWLRKLQSDLRGE